MTPPSTLALFGAGHVCKSLIWSFADLLFGYYAYAYLHLTAADVGWILAISFGYSGVLDVAVAAFLSGRTGYERMVPRLQWIGAACTALSVLALFCPLPLGERLLCYWLLALSIAFRTAYALYDIAQNALVSLLPRSETEARRFVTVRTSLSYGAKILVSLASFLVIGPGGQTALPLLIIVPVACATLAAAYPMARCHTAAAVPETPHDGALAVPLGLLVPILVAVAAQTCLLGLVGRFLPFMKDPHSGASIGALMVLGSVDGGVFGPFLAGRLLRATRGFVAANVGCTCVCMVSAAWMIVGGDRVQLIAAAAMYSIAGGGLSALVWGQFSAAVRCHAQATGRRSDLASFALLTATIKLGAGGTGLFLGKLLEGFQAQQPSALGTIVSATLIGGAVSIAAMGMGHRRIARSVTTVAAPV
ncbi:MFS transporter [Sphingomonas sp. MMS24-J13]|uniref:MFS transporter n=1 Tax=Sphingomonas sp. MMS24-J13 TaxID=3238686 RepID=UPI00384DFA15